MRIKLVRKFANSLNGIDLTGVTVGDIVELHHSVHACAGMDTEERERFPS